MTAPTEAEAAAALLALNRRRRSIRRWLLIALVPLSVAGLVLVVKLLSMYAFAHQSISAFHSAAFAESENAARGQDVWNWLEQFKAPYNIGTALGGGDHLPEARAELERALSLASGLDECYVRINLSLVIERMGDAALAEGQGAEAAALYGEALRITVETPEECHSEQAQNQSPDPNRDMSETLEDNQQRQQEKQQSSQSRDDENDDESEGGGGQSENENEQEGPSQGALDQLEDLLNQGAQEREEQLGDDDGSGGGTDRPW